MPDNLWSGSIGLVPPAPAVPLGRSPLLPELLVDAWGVFLAAPDGTFPGRPAAAPPARLLQAQRGGTRQL